MAAKYATLMQVAVISVLTALLSAGCGNPKTDTAVLIPRLSVPWQESVRILGDSVMGKTFYSDFLLIKDKNTPARWHAIGIHKDHSTLHHAVSNSLTAENWELLDDITSPQPVDRMWAPFAIWSPCGDSAYMYYHHGIGMEEPAMRNSMRVMAAAGPGLDVWGNYDVYPEVEQYPGIKNIVFTGAVPRDACIFFDDNIGKYIMYYAENSPRTVCARTSEDAVHWSQAVEVMGTPEPAEAYVTPESPFVLYRDGLYYLFVSGFDYARVALYVSEDPFDFGDPGKNKIAELNGHAPEIVEEDGKYYIACAHIASVPGMPPGGADLWGNYLQPLDWAEADSVQMTKVVRK